MAVLHHRTHLVLAVKHEVDALHGLGATRRLESNNEAVVHMTKDVDRDPLPHAASVHRRHARVADAQPRLRVELLIALPNDAHDHDDDDDTHIHMHDVNA
jgi:hypothetical protein